MEGTPDHIGILYGAGLFLISPGRVIELCCPVGQSKCSVSHLLSSYLSIFGRYLDTSSLNGRKYKTWDLYFLRIKNFIHFFLGAMPSNLIRTSGKC